MAKKVFVYGTLRKHEENHHLLKESRLVAHQSWTRGCLYDTGLGYPTLVQGENKKVYGEVYEVDEETLQKLDLLEDYHGPGKKNLYERVSQLVHTDNGSFEAIVYVYSPAYSMNLVEIEFGDWKCHRYLKAEELLYFAYGSCMDDERFKLAGVHEQFNEMVGCGIAENFSLQYTLNYHDGGRADMVETDEWVEGKVYKITQETVKYLFKREGVYTNTYRPAFIDVTINGVLHPNVLTFLVIPKSKEVAPPQHYAVEILRGAKGVVSERYYKRLEDDLLKKFNMKVN